MSLLAVFVVVVVVGRHRWFVTDEWDLWAARAVLGHARYGLLDPHDGHLIVVPILVARALFSIFGLRHVVPYLVVLGAAQATLGSALWSLCRACDIEPGIAATGIGAFVLCGAWAENLLFPYQATSVFAIALVIVAVRHFGTSDRISRGDWITGAALTIACATYGLGPVGAAGIVGLGCVRRRWRIGALVGGAPLLVWIAWAALFEGRGANPPPRRSVVTVVTHLPRYVAETLARSAGAVTHSTLLGTVVVLVGAVGLALLLVRHRVPPPRDATIVLVCAAIGLAVANAFSTGPIRTFVDLLGHKQSNLAGHTIQAMVALTLPALLLLIDRVAARVGTAGIVATVAAAVVIVVGNWSTLTAQARGTGPVRCSNNRSPRCSERTRAVTRR